MTDDKEKRGLRNWDIAAMVILTPIIICLGCFLVLKTEFDFRLSNYALSHGEVRYVAGMMDNLHVPLPTPAVDMYEDGKVNFKDYAVLANAWLVETFWP